METFMHVLSVVISLVLIRIVSGYFSRKRTLPPGPFAYPIVGNLFQVGSKPHISMANLAKIHGPLMSLKLGQIQTLVISSPLLAKQIFQVHDLTFSDRVVTKEIHIHNHHNLSIFLLPFGPLWRNLKKVTDSCLVSNNKLETQHILAYKVKQLLSHVEQCSRTHTPIEFDQIAFETLLDILSTLILSLDLTDSTCDTVREFKEVLKHIGDEASILHLVDFFPILSNIYPLPIRDRVGVYFGRLFDLFDRLFDERLLARKESTYVSTNDMLDSLLSMSKSRKKCIDRTTIKHLFMDLFVAGADTTGVPLEWAMIELLKNPETLTKARAEIEQVIGKDVMIKESDVAQLPYLRAIVKETLRLHPAVPLLLPRIARADVVIEGYTISKGTQVIVNVWAIGRDSNVWENPDVFMPERFLGSEIDVLGKHFELIPFSSGRRMCAGMHLAIRMLHLMLGSLIQHFDWKLEDGVTPDSIDKNVRIATINKPPPLRVIPVQVTR
ncbi:Cytochrome P450 76T24 [Euphorbia peplus]|nr:Cytochrome P450 76T24 [Euphorbia peplus]